MFYIFLFLLYVFSKVTKTNGPHGGCHSPPYYGQPNLIPINELSEHSKLIKQVTNGKLYEITVPQDKDVNSTTFALLHVWGTAYEMGFAQGGLRDKEIYQKYMNDIWAYFEGYIEEYLHKLPKWLQDLIADIGLSAALDFTYEITKGWTNQVFWDEMNGFAASTGVKFNRIMKIHMLPGLIQGQCSMIGAWGDAVDQEKNGLLQLRAFDWDMDGPFIDFPQVTVYHPNEGNGHDFANVGWMGFIGGLTGVSKEKIGISQIGVSFPDDSFGKMSRIGMPFIFLLRDILQYDKTIEDGTNRMINTHRTCIFKKFLTFYIGDLIMGIGDGKSLEFNSFQYSYSVLNVFTWDNANPKADWHSPIKNVVYYGMDWLCPPYMEVLANQTIKYLGKLSAPVGISYITSVEESGDNHLAFYALDKEEMWLSFGSRKIPGEEREGYARQFTHMDLSELWKEKKP